MRDFATMKSNVGVDLQDTSTDMATIIGRYINKRYLDILRLTNTRVVNHSFYISFASGYGLATLPSDFGKEMYCVSTDKDTTLKYIDFEEVNRDNPSLTDNGDDADLYTIFTDSNGAKQMKIWDTPKENVSFALPYIVRPTALSASTDQPLIACEDAIEAGALADAWRYKRQLAKAQSMEIMYQDLLSNFVWDNENRMTARQFTPTTFNRDNL
jgi:hypothetical protein